MVGLQLDSMILRVFSNLSDSMPLRLDVESCCFTACSQIAVFHFLIVLNRPSGSSSLWIFFNLKLQGKKKKTLCQIKAMTTCREVNKRLRGKRRESNRQEKKKKKKDWFQGRNISPLLDPVLSLVWVLIHGWWVNEGKCECSPWQSIKLHSFILRHSLG